MLLSLAGESLQSQIKPQEGRQSKIEIILQTQDLRTPHHGTLLTFLTDTDAVVRERAARAFGNIEDTIVIQMLVQLLNDPDPDVESSAAFAVCQTASRLSERSRETLEHDLIWTRLGLMQPNPADRLIEELGKFGTGQGLDDLVRRFGGTYPQAHARALVMCAARFAIRGVTTPDAVHYLMQFIRSPEPTTWQVMYALQRIGNRDDIRSELDHLAKLYTYPDPLVRMYLASLLGKLKDERTALVPLQKLAEFDSDWRVRVNALKALSNFHLQGHDDVVLTFKRAFLSENRYIGLTALSAFGNTGLRDTGSGLAITETFSLLRQIAENNGNGYPWELQGEAAISLANLEAKSATGFIKPGNWSQPLLQAKLLEALGYTGDPYVAPILYPFAEDSSPAQRVAALDGLRTLCEKNSHDTTLVNRTYDLSLAGLASGDVAVVTTSASILGDSLFRRASSVVPLTRTLQSLRLPYDIEAMQTIASALGNIHDNRAIDVLSEQLRQADRSVALSSAVALHAITGRDYSTQLLEWYRPPFTDFDFTYLRSLPETLRVTMETIRGNIVIELYKNLAPFTVMSFLKLATERGFYRGLIFHRVVPNFVIQGGDPRGDGWGGPEYSLRSEFSSLTFDRGMVGMADAGKDTEGSQFFITQSPQPHLDGRYTIFGKVISGMSVVDQIQLGDHLFDVKVLQ